MSSRTELNFIHPVSKDRLLKADNGDLFLENQTNEPVFVNHGGSFDFVSSVHQSDEKDFYDDAYSNSTASMHSVEELRDGWNKEPGFQSFLESMGDLKEKKVLLLGNGGSTKEMSLLEQGAYCVFTDLSFESVKFLNELFIVFDGIIDIRVPPVTRLTTPSITAGY